MAADATRCCVTCIDDCPPPPLLVGHAARVCVSGMPPVVVAVAVVAGCVVGVVVVVVGGARGSELRWLTRSRRGWWVTQLGFCVGVVGVVLVELAVDAAQSWVTDCPPSPLLVGHAARACIGGMPVVVAIAVVAGFVLTASEW